jgi:hypothetical protein
MWLEIGDPGWLATCEDETITVDVLLTANGFNGIEFDLDFDASLLEVTNVAVGSMWPTGVTNPQNTIDNTNGVVEFGAYVQQPDFKLSVTDGQVAQITFKELDTSGTSILDINDVIVSNTEGQSLAVTLEDGSLEVKGCGCVHGIVEVQGRFGDWDCADITVSGGPGGSYNTHVDNLDGTWQICDIVEGDYDVEVEMALYLDGLKEDVSIVDAGDTDVGQVKVLGGDCNDGDGSSPCGSPYYGVNINDATIVGGEFGNSGGGIGDDRADINDDDTVNILDASLLGGNWHKCSPVPW